jgi:plastocyanin
MNRLRAGCTALLALGIAAACTKDPVSGEPEARGVTADRALSDNRSSHGENDFSGPRHIVMRDDCDPRDPAWGPTGGCSLKRGDVTFAEFNEENDSPLAAAVVGHQAWRNDPSYLKIKVGKSVRITNAGGRVHTFTKVAEFGGGKVPSPALNEGLVTAPECPTSADIPPGGRARVSGLAAGNHRFQCCIHPWMRALIKVKPDRDHGED